MSSCLSPERLYPILTDRVFCHSLTPGMERFVRLLCDHGQECTSVRQLLPMIDVGETTFITRFVRCGVATPKDLLTYVRLLHGAWLFDQSHRPVADVGVALGLGSGQAYNRHLKMVLGVTASAFRAEWPFPRMTAHIRDLIQRTHPATWRWFDPYAWRGGKGSREHVAAKALIADALTVSA